MEKVGLSTKEAQISREQHGSNSLTEVKRDSFFSKLKDNFGDPMIKILCVALIINVIFAFMGKSEWYESVGIAAAVAIATFISTYSEYKNEGAFQKLQEEASKITCKVYRDGEIIELSIDQIVVGDCVLLQSGDKIPADGFVYDGTLSVDQSVLNGESKEAKKIKAPTGYSPNKNEIDFLSEHDLYRGAIVCSGNAIMQVSSVGDSTIYGEIASELQQEDGRESPLKVKLAALAKGISRFGYIVGIAIAAAFMFQSIVIANNFDIAQISAYCSDWMNVANSLVSAVMLAVIIIVMAVPEGLPLMIALVSSMNMGKMLKDNVLVRDINSIETAGSLNILFSDKTGTITKGHLEVVTFIDGELNQHKKISEVGSFIKQKFICNAVHNSEAIITGEGKSKRAIGGNATERALLNFIYADPANSTDSTSTCETCEDTENNSELSKNIGVEAQIPFTSARKFSAVALQPSSDKRIMIKGAPEIVLAKCSSYYGEDGNKQPLDINAMNSVIDELAAKTIRVLAFAECDGEIKDDQICSDSDWTCVGLVGIRDDIRPESASAVKETQAAGIQVVMITGDRRETAQAIASEIGLIHKKTDLVFTSAELREMSDEEIADCLKDIRVVARALPTDKSRLVRIAQSQNLVVGMTGDGVNDSAALKKADIGFAMGSGTEVAKEASEIVILDDNFNSIEKAVLYGRTIFNSIRKFIVYQLTINVSAVLISFFFPLLGMDQMLGIQNPLTITQILWINLIMDTLAALAFGGEPALRRYMQEKPKRRDDKIVNRYMWSSIIVGSVWVFALSMVFLLTPFVHDIFRDDSANCYLMTGYFCFFVFAAVFNAFNARTEKLNLFDNIKGNRGFIRVLLLISVVQIVLAYVGGAIFNCYGLSFMEWAVVIVLAFTVIPVDLMRKLISRSGSEADSGTSPRTDSRSSTEVVSASCTGTSSDSGTGSRSRSHSCTHEGIS